MHVSWLILEPLPIALVFLLGLCLGSFLNVVIHRLPRGLSMIRPPSHCPACSHRVRRRHNLPLFGWLWLRGRCPDCGGRIPVRYPAVELLGGLFTVLAVFAFSTPLQSLSALWLFLSLTAVLWIDLEHRIIPDPISLGGTALGLLLAHWTIGLVASVSGMLAGGVGLFLVRWLYQRTRGRAGMGLGDVKLAAMLGAFLGPAGIALTVLVASFLGSVLGIALLLTRRGSGATALPFGSFLAPAAMAALLWGSRIWTWYSGLLVRH
jgi:leader peptidase (prepilin peptidase) / N-methyltransferase